MPVSKKPVFQGMQDCTCAGIRFLWIQEGKTGLRRTSSQFHEFFRNSAKRFQVFQEILRERGRKLKVFPGLRMNKSEQVSMKQLPGGWKNLLR